LVRAGQQRPSLAVHNAAVTTPESRPPGGHGGAEVPGSPPLPGAGAFPGGHPARPGLVNVLVEATAPIDPLVADRLLAARLPLL
jgi:hypothetical protein